MSQVERTLPFALARAYGVERVARPERVTVSPLRHADSPESARLVRGQGASRLVAGVVPGGIDFSSDGPVSTASALPMYRHPADRNAAAVSIHAGRVLDVNA